MNIQLKAKRQDGFTIIELVVVILLLGILAATALPRFMDVTDEAHDSVVEGVLGGLNTGVAMFRATWVATGQPTDEAVDYPDDSSSLYANGAGYPIGNDDTFAAGDCKQIFDGLLQAGGQPTVYASTAVFQTGTTDDETYVETATAADTTGADFISGLVSSTADADDATGCNFYYVGQHRSGEATPNDQSIPYLTYSFTTGAVVPGATEIALDTDAP